MLRSYFGTDTMVLLEVSNLLNHTKETTNGELEYYFVICGPIVAPYSGLGSLINNTTYFEIRSRPSE